jgi:hypothetical protein
MDPGYRDIENSINPYQMLTIVSARYSQERASFDKIRCPSSADHAV